MASFMRLYSGNGGGEGNTFIVLNDEERVILQQKYVKMTRIVFDNMPSTWNDYDTEMIVFLPKLFHYHSSREECQMLDPTLSQLKKVDMMLCKVDGIPNTFVEWMQLIMEDQFSDVGMMKKIMDEKRKKHKVFLASEELKAQHAAFNVLHSDILSFDR